MRARSKAASTVKHLTVRICVFNEKARHLIGRKPQRPKLRRSFSAVFGLDLALGASRRCNRAQLDTRLRTRRAVLGGLAAATIFLPTIDLTGCRYYGRALLSARPVHRFILTLQAAESRPPPSLLSHCPFAHPPIRSYIYCIEETRAAAFLAHAPPVMSGLQSCLSFRPSVQRTGRPVAFHTPYSRSLLDLSPPLLSSFLYRRPLFFARARLPRYSISPPSTGTLRVQRCTCTRLHGSCKTY